jgi:hypothetical protein
MACCRWRVVAVQKSQRAIPWSSSLPNESLPLAAAATVTSQPIAIDPPLRVFVAFTVRVSFLFVSIPFLSPFGCVLMIADGFPFASRT